MNLKQNTQVMINVNTGMSILDLNIRRLSKNFDEVLVLYENIKIFFDIIILNESWFDSRRK